MLYNIHTRHVGKVTSSRVYAHKVKVWYLTLQMNSTSSRNNNNNSDDANGMYPIVLPLASIRDLAYIQRNSRTVIGHVCVISKLWAIHCVPVIFVIPFGWNSMQEHSNEVSSAIAFGSILFYKCNFLFSTKFVHSI